MPSLRTDVRRPGANEQGVRPSVGARRALEAVAAKDASDPTLARRAGLFIAIDMASIERFAHVQGHGDAPDRDCTEDARAYLKALATDDDTRLEPLRAEQLGRAHALFAECLAALAHGAAPKALRERIESADAATLQSVDAVLDLFEALTSVRFDARFPSELNEDDARSLAADFVRFASGSLSVAPFGSTGLFNCAPNGSLFCLFPTVALVGRIRRLPALRRQPDRVPLWDAWLRATAAGLEAFFATHDRGHGAWDASRYIEPLAPDAPALRPWSRAQGAELVERMHRARPPALERSIGASLRAAFRDLGPDEVLNVFRPVDR